MSRYTVRYRLAGEPHFHKVVIEALDMKGAIDAGYGIAKGMHGLAIIDFNVSPKA